MPDFVTCNGKQTPLAIFMKLTIILITHSSLPVRMPANPFLFLLLDVSFGSTVCPLGCQLILFFSPFGCLFWLHIEFRMVTRELCKLPTFFTTVLFNKIDKESTGLVTRQSANFSCLPSAKLLYKLCITLTISERRSLISG